MDNLGVGWGQIAPVGHSCANAKQTAQPPDTGGHSAPGLVAISGGLGVQKQRKALMLLAILG